MADPSSERDAAIAEEAHRARVLRMVVDLVSNVLMQERLTRSEAEALVEATRKRALELFPDKAETYDLILAPRFARLMEERFGSRRVLAFTPRGAPRH
jgi:hypothetical protein